jgi:hypothetical protein
MGVRYIKQQQLVFIVLLASTICQTARFDDAPAATWAPIWGRDGEGSYAKQSYLEGSYADGSYAEGSYAEGQQKEAQQIAFCNASDIPDGSVTACGHCTASKQCVDELYCSSYLGMCGGGPCPLPISAYHPDQWLECPTGNDNGGSTDGIVASTGLAMRWSDPYIWTQAHNIKRCMHGLDYVKWNQQAVDGDQGAKAWADKGNGLDHSDCFNLPPPFGPAGENVAILSEAGNPEAVVNAWYEEIKACDWSTGCEPAERLATAADGADSGLSGEVTTGHATAMVWRGTTEIACAWSSGAAFGTELDESVLYVCRYLNDAPNVAGRFKTEVPPPQEQPGLKRKEAREVVEARCARTVEEWMAEGEWCVKDDFVLLGDTSGAAACPARVPVSSTNLVGDPTAECAAIVPHAYRKCNSASADGLDALAKDEPPVFRVTPRAASTLSQSYLPITDDDGDDDDDDDDDDDGFAQEVITGSFGDSESNAGTGEGSALPVSKTFPNEKIEQHRTR